MKKVFRANLYFFIIILLEVIAPFFMRYVYYFLGVTDIRVALVVNHIVIFIIPAIIYIIVTKSNVKETFKLNKVSFKDIGMIFLLSIVARPAMSFLSLVTSMFFDNNIAQVLDTISSTPYIILVMIIAVLPSITEEITIRGVVLSGYDEKGMMKTAAITGLMFGIFHLDGQQFLYAAALGFILALLVRITNSIFSSVLLHFLINATSVTLQQLLMKLPNVGEMAENTSIKDMNVGEKIMMLQVYIIPAVISCALCALILIKMKKWSDERKGLYKPSYSKNPQVNSYISGDASGEKTTFVKEPVYSKERIVNWPFIATIIVYVGYMTLEIIATK